jgi:hypothetical protein
MAIRRWLTLATLAVLAAVMFVGFPAEIHTGMTWKQAAQRLCLVPRLPVDSSLAIESPGVYRLFVLLDGTCVGLVFFPRNNNDDTLFLKSIEVGRQFEGYPGKFAWLDNATRCSSLNLTGYTFCRMLSYACIVGIGWHFVTLFRRRKK